MGEEAKGRREDRGGRREDRVRERTEGERSSEARVEAREDQQYRGERGEY